MVTGLSTAKVVLKQKLKEAYEQAADDGSAGNKDTIKNLATNMKDAIHEFMLQAKVVTVVTLDPGQPSAPGGSSIAPTPGVGQGKLL